MLLMGDIYSGLDSINMQEHLLYTPGQGDNANRREEIKNNLSAIKARLAANSRLLAQMEKRLKSSNSDNKVLNNTIARLKEHISQQESRIAELQGQLEQANQQITSLTGQVQETQEQLASESAAKEEAQQQVVETTNELNTVYYAIGTNKELKQQGLLEKKFLGSTKVMKGDFNASYFTKADLRTLSSIPTQGKKVKIWSNMPANSYEIVTNSNGNKTINILDATKFWSLSHYLIIQID
jgi:DNA repair exonuclease SbcCD ATPase subunit